MTPIAPGVSLPPPLCLGVIGADKVGAFAAASGDFNPIHLSDDVARRAGLDNAVVHGMFIAAGFEAYLESVPETRLRTLQTKFVRPLPVGETLVVSARLLSAAGSELHLRLLAKSPAGTLFAAGEARLERLAPSSAT
jgi:acyl dehydratase